MKKSIVSIGALVGAFILPANIASAQTLPDIQDAITQGSQIDDAVFGDTGGTLNRPDAATEIDGEAGIYVLRTNDIFFIGGAAGLSYSGNPLRTAGDVGDSFAADFAATAGVRTQIDGSVDLGLTAVVSGTEYFESFAPSSRNAHAAINLGTLIAGTPLYASITGFGGYNFDSDFENGTSFYGGTARLAASFPLAKRTALVADVQASRQWSGISENNSTAASGSLRIDHQIDPRLRVGASATVKRTWFDNFYEDVTFVERSDWTYGGALLSSYAISENFSASVSAGYEKRDSSFFLSEYESFEGSLLFSARLRF